jgi:hypothetical protein
MSSRLTKEEKAKIIELRENVQDFIGAVMLVAFIVVFYMILVGMSV